MKARQEGKKNLLYKGLVSLMFGYCRTKQLVLSLSMKANVREQLVCFCSSDELHLTWSHTFHKNSNYARFKVTTALMNWVFWLQMLSCTFLVPDISDKYTAFVFRVEEF
jgi:hypothetical protein